MTGDFIFSESPGKIYVEWKIQNIFEQSRKKEFRLNSPPFSLCCLKWHLMAYVKPQCQLPLSGWLDLYLNKETCSGDHCISCRIGIKKADREVKSFNFECRSGSEENSWGMTDFAELKEHFNNRTTVETPALVQRFSFGTPLEVGPQFVFGTTAKAADSKFVSAGRRKKCLSFGHNKNPRSQSVSSLSTVDFTSDGSLTLFCSVHLRDANTVPSPISSSNESETFSENIKDLYINKRYTDVKIEVKDKEFLAHKCILAARSAVFASMFDHDTVEKSTGNVKITDCDPDSFQEFLIFLYTGKLGVVSSNNAMSLYKTADKYNLEELMEECVRCMVRELSVDSFCDVFHFATVHDETDLLMAARNFFNDNVKTIISTLKWLNLLEEHPSLCNELFIKFVDK